MMLTALILMGNPSCELQLETEQSRPVGHLAWRLCMLIKVLFTEAHDKSANFSVNAVALIYFNHVVVLFKKCMRNYNHLWEIQSSWLSSYLEDADNFFGKERSWIGCL